MWGVLSAFISALLATACCLPALLFLLFGVSFGFLSFLENLTFLRLPLTILSLFLLFIAYKAHQKRFTCNFRKRTFYMWIYLGVLGSIVLILLLPEIGSMLFEENE